MGEIFYVHTVTPSIIKLALSVAHVVLPVRIMACVSNFPFFVFRQGILILKSIKNYPKSRSYTKKVKLDDLTTV